MKRICTFWIGPLILVFVWQLISAFKVIDPLFISSPFEVGKSLFSLLITDGTIYPSLYASLRRMFLGFSAGLILGIPAGLLIGSSKRIYAATEFLIDFLRSIPSTSFLPLFMLILGVEDGPKIAVVILGCFFVCLINTAYGVIHSNQTRIFLGQIMGASKYYIFAKIRFYDALPSIASGVRVAISYAVVLVVVSEMFIGTDKGIGRFIYDSHYTFQTAQMYAVIIITGTIGFLANKVFSFYERRYIHWSKNKN